MRFMYKLDPQSVEDFLKENKVEKVAIQAPEGIRPKVKELEDFFLSKDVEPIFLAKSCYGACDVADRDAVGLGCDALIHYGHSDMGLDTEVPTLYVEARMEVDPLDALEKALPELRGSVWGLVSTVQHVHFLSEVQEFLEEEEIESKIGEPGARAEYPGQILGCDWGSSDSVADEVDGFIYIGTGEFHPMGVALSTGSPVIAVNPVANNFERFDLDMDDFFQKRWALISSVQDAESIGVLVSTKEGQNRKGLAEELKVELEDEGYDAYILVFDDIIPSSLEDFQLDAFVNTACPRISFSDQESFRKPILSPFEVRVLCGSEDWEDYQLDEISV